MEVKKETCIESLRISGNPDIRNLDIRESGYPEDFPDTLIAGYPSPG